MTRSAALVEPDATTAPALTLTPAMAGAFARIALGHVQREYPNKPGHVLAHDGDARTPSALHPIFHGSYDWHSCVHSYWMLARLIRAFPDLPERAEVEALFDAQLVPEKVAAERAYFERAESRGFERPYGWAWLLALAAELSRHDAERWARALAPLADTIVERFRAFLPIATYPVRVGTHFNTAFALRLAMDHADACEDVAFAALLRATALRWYGDDTACPAWGEPGGDDFLSPALIEAECMRRLLPPDDFARWFDGFLPHLASREPATLLRPAIVSDRGDGKIAHLDGLNLSRAWCWRRFASTLDGGDPRRAIMSAAAAAHLAVGLPHLAGDYMGEHWLATYAVLALDDHS